MDEEEGEEEKKEKPSVTIARPDQALNLRSRDTAAQSVERSDGQRELRRKKRRQRSQPCVAVCVVWSGWRKFGGLMRKEGVPF